MMKDTIVLYPSSGISHLVPMVELAQLLLTHNPSFSITVLIATLPSDTASTASYIAAPSGFPALFFEFMTLNNNDLRQTLKSMSQTSSIKAFIIDFFCNTSYEISANLNIPTYYFYTSGANGLALFLYLSTIDRNITKSLKDDLNIHIHVPGTPSFVASDMPLALLDRSTKVYQYFLDTANQMAKSSGIIINTFKLLEPRAIKAISEGFCVPDAPTPPIFCIGPLVSSTKRPGGGGDEDECLSWLNTQPSRSVVFLSFGSMGLFSSEQLKEIAIGLERSGVRFLWVVRMEERKGETPQRTKDRGYLVNSWAPQVAVLSHDSVGGFVTHCGWNSILESICAGVPMVAWPLYAEQKFNRVILVEEFKVALPVNQSENEFVSATELENRVTELMNSEKGRALRDRVTAMREDAKAAMREGGSYRVELSNPLPQPARSSVHNS
ncbi:hypothetical protein AAG906_008724 [Vitis piasezkii]